MAMAVSDACTCELCRKRALYAEELAAASGRRGKDQAAESAMPNLGLYSNPPPIGPRPIFMLCRSCAVRGSHHPGRKDPWVCGNGCDPAYYLQG